MFQVVTQDNHLLPSCLTPSLYLSIVTLPSFSLPKISNLYFLLTSIAMVTNKTSCIFSLFDFSMYIVKSHRANLYYLHQWQPKQLYSIWYSFLVSSFQWHRKKQALRKYSFRKSQISENVLKEGLYIHNSFWCFIISTKCSMISN